MTNKEAINLLDNLIGMIEDNQNSDYDKALKMAIEALKQPEREKGEWIDREHDNCFMCSACGEVWIGIGGYNYCPNFGADMRGDNNEIN